jgi:ribose transport system permease protein
VSAQAPRRRALAIRDFGIVGAFAVLFVTLSITSPFFLTWRNLTNILDQNASVGLIAVGGTLVMIAGSFDLSVGAIYAIAGVIAGLLAPDIGAPAALLIGSLVGLGFGAFTGALTTVGRVNSFVATLGMAIIITGLALVLTGGFLVSVTESSFRTLGQGAIGSVTYGVIIWLGFALLCGFLLNRTVLGSAIYAVGGSAEAARLSGIRVGAVRAVTFAISGFSASLAGVIVTSKVGQGQADVGGFPLTFLAIAAIVIGGTSILGGEGAIWRSVVGVLLLAMIGNGFNLLGVDPNYQNIFRGVIIIGAVALDAWLRTGDRTGIRKRMRRSGTDG